MQFYLRLFVRLAGALHFALVVTETPSRETGGLLEFNQ